MTAFLHYWLVWLAGGRERARTWARAHVYMGLWMAATLGAPLLGQARPAGLVDLPPNLAAQPPYAAFVRGKVIKTQKALRLPQSNFVLVYVAVGRTQEPEMWSGDPADGLDARIFVYDLATRAILPGPTIELNRQLGADQHYDGNFCGGLGSLAPADFRLEGNRVALSQFYAPGTARDNCAWEIVLAGGRVVAQKKGAGDSGLASVVAKERADLNQRAVRLYQARQVDEAIYVWEELYGYWLNGPYSTAGPYDEILNNLGFAYHRLKLYKPAEQVLLECKRHFPARKIVYLNLADLYRDMQNRPAARQYYQQFLRLDVSEAQRAYAQAELKKLQ
jgi:tetratricopeptide (TPR) repeat protein